MEERIKYIEKIFKGIDEKMKTGVWYDINPGRPDYKEFIEAVKLRIEINKDCEFSSDWTKIKKTGTISEISKMFNTFEFVNKHER